MTTPLPDTLNLYCRGLKRQLDLLSDLLKTASAQRDALLLCDIGALDAASHEREQIMAGILELEAAQQPLRQRIAEDVEPLRSNAVFAEIERLHVIGNERVQELLAFDEQIRSSIERVDDERRAAAHALDAGEATLAAYRKTLRPTQTRSSLVDERG